MNSTPSQPVAPKPSGKVAIGISVHDVADEARRAALGFLHGTASGWGRKELALWLATSYGKAVAGSPNGAGRQRKTLLSADGQEDIAVERTLLRAREELVELLTSFGTSEGSAAFAHDLIETGFVVRVFDTSGSFGYVPLDAPEMRLIDRVASLFAADYLTRPSDYRALTICEDCGQCSFDWAPTHEAVCAHSFRDSGVVPKNATPAPDFARTGEDRA